MLHRSVSRRGLAGMVAVAFLVIAGPSVVAAHAELESSSPADGATVPSPFTGPIGMTFSAALADGSKADLVGPDGTVVASASVDGPGATMTIELDAPLPAGSYEVKWVSVAEDTDLERGTFSFTVAPAPATPSPAPTVASAIPSVSATPAIESAEPTVTAAASPSESPAAADASTSADVVLPIVVALIVVGAGAVFLLGRRNRTPLS